MPTTQRVRKPASKAAKTPRRERTTDAIALLKADHKKVSALFEQYGKSRSPAKKQDIVATICQELSVHAVVEEEIFYPEVKAALKDKALVPEARVEHAALKEFIAKVDGRLPEGEVFDALVQVMGEYVKHHVKEEQTEMFPKVRKSKLDLAVLGQRIQTRKAELLAAPGQIPKAPNALADMADGAPA